MLKNTSIIALLIYLETFP